MYKAVQNIGDTPCLRGNRQNRVQIAQYRHFAVPAGMRRVIQTGVVVGDAFITVGCNDSLVQELAFLVAQIGNQQREENVQLLDFGSQFRLLRHRTVQQFAAGVVDFANLHDIDAVRAARHNANNRAIQRFGLPVKFMAFQRCNNVDRRTS